MIQILKMKIGKPMYGHVIAVATLVVSVMLGYSGYTQQQRIVASNQLNITLFYAKYIG